MNSALTHLRRAASITATLWLSAVHAGFLWRRVADESLTEPRVLARWLGAGLVLAVFIVVRRTRSRRSSPVILVLWLLVALLHAIVPAGDQILDARGELSLILQTGLAALPAGLVLAALLIALTERDRRTAFLPGARQSFAWSLPAGLPDTTRAPPTR
jgi:hypothetical protein